MEFLKQLYANPDITRPLLDNLEFKTLDDVQKDLLERPLSKEEIKKVI